MIWKNFWEKAARILEYRAISWVKNRYFLSGFLFLVWMAFLDTHSLKIHYKLHKEIRQAKRAIAFYNSEIEKDRELIRQLESDPAMLERFAREHYYFRKPNEKIFIIETK